MVALDLSQYTVLRSYYVGRNKMATIVPRGSGGLGQLQVNFDRIVAYHEKQFYKALTK